MRFLYIQYVSYISQSELEYCVFFRVADIIVEVLQLAYMSTTIVSHYEHCLQEYGNVPFVVQGGFGVYTGNSPRRIADQVGALLVDEPRLRGMSQRARQLSRPEATKSIASDIAKTMLNDKR